MSHTYQHVAESTAPVADAITTVAGDNLETITPVAPVDTIFRDPNPFFHDAPVDIMSRRVLVYTGTWSSSQVAGTKILELPLVYSLFASAPIRALTTQYTHFRYKSIRLCVELASVPTCRGSLKVFYFTGSPNFPVTNNYLNYAQANGTYVGPTHQNSTELVIPFQYPFDAIKFADLVTDNYAYGSCGLAVEWPLVNDLQIGSAAGLPYSIYMQFEDPEFFFPCNQSAIAAPGAPGAPTTENLFTLNLAAQSGQVNKEAVRKTERGIISGIIEDAKVLNSSVSRIPGAKVLTDPLTTGLAFASKISNFLGLSKPLNLQPVQYVNTYLYTDTASKHGQTNAISLSSNMANTIACNPELLNVKMDEMDLMKFTKIPSLLYLASVSTTTTGSVFSMGVFPSTVQNVGTSTINTGFNYIYDTRLARACRFASHWRGNIKYIARVTASSIVRAKMVWLWSPINSFDYNSNVKFEFDINGDTISEFEVPYASAYDWLPIAFEQGSTNHHMANGFVSLYVLNPPSVSTSTTNITIGISIDIVGGEGFTLQGTRPLIGTGFQHLIGNETSTGFAKKSPMNSLTQQGPELASNLMYDENDYHLRSVCHRAFPSTQLYANGTTVRQLVQSSADSELQFITAHYFYWRSSMIYRFLPTNSAALTGNQIASFSFDDTNTSANTPVLSTNSLLPSGNQGTIYQDFYRSSAFALKVPWQSNVRALPTWNVSTVPTPITYASRVYLNTTTPSGIRLTALESYDEDLLLSNLAPSPIIAQATGVF
jgi:hypothetical protein